MVERAEFTEKKFWRLITPVINLYCLAFTAMNDYEPEREDLKKLKMLLDEFKAGEHKKHGKLITLYDAVFDFVIKLADRDEHYRMRLYAFWMYFRQWKPKINAGEREWLKAWKQRAGDKRDGN